MADDYTVELAPAAVRQLRKLPAAEQQRVRDSLRRLSHLVAEGAVGARGGKSLKKLKGQRDEVFRLRVGDVRVLFDVVAADRVILVLAIVNRRDLDRALRRL
jgi:mRNA interferase RelE/StbE